MLPFVMDKVRFSVRSPKKQPPRRRPRRLFIQRLQGEGFGGARRDRTDDLLLAKQALSQLSYGPMIVGHSSFRAERGGHLRSLLTIGEQMHNEVQRENGGSGKI